MSVTDVRHTRVHPFNTTFSRYGLLGPNGCGKSTLLKALAARDVPIAQHIDIYLLDREIAASDMTALESVMSVDEEKVKKLMGQGAVGENGCLSD